MQEAPRKGLQLLTSVRLSLTGGPCLISGTFHQRRRENQSSRERKKTRPLKCALGRNRQFPPSTWKQDDQNGLGRGRKATARSAGAPAAVGFLPDANMLARPMLLSGSCDQAQTTQAAGSGAPSRAWLHTQVSGQASGRPGPAGVFVQSVNLPSPLGAESLPKIGFCFHQ